MVNSLHKIRCYPVIDEVDFMDSLQVPFKARFLSETFAAVDAREIAFPAALPIHMSAQIAEHRVVASTFSTGEAAQAGPRETC